MCVIYMLPAEKSGLLQSRPSGRVQTSACSPGRSWARHWLSSRSGHSMPDPCLHVTINRNNICTLTLQFFPAYDNVTALLAHIIHSAAFCSNMKLKIQYARKGSSSIHYHHALLLYSDWLPQSPRTSPGSPLPGTHWEIKGWRLQFHVYLCCLCIIKVNDITNGFYIASLGQITESARSVAHGNLTYSLVRQFKGSLRTVSVMTL